MKSHFLRAAWNNLIMANYEVPHKILDDLIPAGTELDFFEGKTYVSLIGFMFMNTRILGFSVPYHINFEEVNLRFYLKYSDGGEIKRGVSFVRELVPKPAITLVANKIYNEKYQAVKMKHFHHEGDNELSTGYQWKQANTWYKLECNTEKKSHPMRVGSMEEFIAEHYWGFTKVNKNKTTAYEVYHPRWEIFPVNNYLIECDFDICFGKKFAFLNEREPSSVFMARGSEIKIFHKKTINFSE